MTWHVKVAYYVLFFDKHLWGKLNGKTQCGGELNLGCKSVISIDSSILEVVITINMILMMIK
jgi:hypothetical protein